MFFLLTTYNKLTPAPINVELVNDVGLGLKMFGSLVSIEETIVMNANTMELIQMNVHCDL